MTIQEEDDYKKYSRFPSYYFQFNESISEEEITVTNLVNSYIGSLYNY